MLKNEWTRVKTKNMLTSRKTTQYTTANEK